MLKSIAFIPDGNRRFARKKGISYAEAYEAGFRKAEEVFDWCLAKGINSATVYALSTENLKRHKDELQVLFSLYKKYLKELAKSDRIHNNGVRVKIIGRKGLNGLDEAITAVEEATAGYDRCHLNIALGYSGRSEILDAIKKAASAGLNLTSIDENAFFSFLDEPNEIDLLIRTGGEARLSNFLLWQTAYTELYFCNCLWPEFTKSDFDSAIEWYNQIKRNFGR